MLMRRSGFPYESVPHDCTKAGKEIMLVPMLEFSGMAIEQLA